MSKRRTKTDMSPPTIPPHTTRWCRPSNNKKPPIKGRS